MTVLVRRRALGDVVLLGAVTGAIEGPVTVVTEARFVPLVRRLRGVDQAVAFGEPVPAGLVIDLQRDLRTLAAFPFAHKLRKHSLARWLGRGRPDVPTLYGRACGVSPVPTPWIDVDGPRDALALIPGASCAPKRWAPERFAAVGRAWAGPVHVVGGPGDGPLVDAVADAVPGSSRLVESGFDETLARLGACRVAVGADTGLLHLAAACGARPIALFGPTHPRDGFFPYPDGLVVSLDEACRPCTRHRIQTCPRGHHRCMGQPVERVIAACVS